LDLFMEALNVSIYGLGIVFMTLLILMFAIMVLSKVFSVATGKEIMVAPGVAPVKLPRQETAPPAVAQAVAPETLATHAPPLQRGAAIPEMAAAPVAAEVVGAVYEVIAPLPGKILSVPVTAGTTVRRGDELCVIEAMKMGNSIKAEMDGIVREVLVAPGQTVGFGASLVIIATAAPSQPIPAAPAPSSQPAPAAPAAAPTPAAPPQPAAPSPALSGFRLGVGDKQHKVTIEGAGGGKPTVKVDGKEFRVERDQANRDRIIVDGTPHTVEVREVSGNQATVVIDGQTRQVSIAPAGAPASYRLASGEKSYDVQISDPASSDPTVSVGGTSYEVKRDKDKITVNGKPHFVQVKEVSGNSITVTVDGVTRVIQMAPADAPSPAPPSPAPARAPAAAPAPVAQPAPAPAPMQPETPPAPPPAPAAPPVQSAPVSAAEAITAPLPGKILTVAVKPGDVVSRGDELCVIEAMKMGNSIRAQRDGTVAEVLVAPGQTVSFGVTLLLLQ
jgi:biotin carboxyl carrier protein